MAIRRLIPNTAFGPKDIARLVAAYEPTLRALRLKDRDDPITQLVAEKIIAIGRLGIDAKRSFFVFNESAKTAAPDASEWVGRRARDYRLP
jgi:hypothetical protein